jgi:hypothetical protein
MSCGFTYSHYASMLDQARTTHAFQDYATALANPRGRSIILRHDLDFSARPALELARMEAARGIRSTYFILLGGPYDALAEPERAHVRALVALGHRLGLHFDLEAYDRHAVEPAVGIARDARILAETFETPVGVASQHRPGKIPANGLLDSTGLLDAYGPQFTRDRKYLSDSRQHWRDGCLCEALRCADRWPRLQVLVHPIWWSSDGAPMGARLSSLGPPLGQASRRV